jgi:hypothetical protein
MLVLEVGCAGPKDTDIATKHCKHIIPFYVSKSISKSQMAVKKAKSKEDNNLKIVYFLQIICPFISQHNFHQH